MTGDALWSAAEVRLQSEQVRGQLDVWDVLAERIPCPACNAHADEPCQPDCVGKALHLDALRCTCPPSGFLCDWCDQ